MPRPSQEPAALTVSRCLIAHGEPTIRRLHVAGFRSIRRLTLELGEETILVGANGVGKSNLIDALVFMADAVHRGIEIAIGERDGLSAIQHQQTGGGRRLDIRLQLQLGWPEVKTKIGYGFALCGTGEGAWKVKEEWLAVDGVFVLDANATEVLVGPAGLEVDVDRLALPLLSGVVAKSALKVLRTVRRYVPDLAALRRPQPVGSAVLLSADTSNLVNVWAELERAHPKRTHRIVTLLQQVLPTLLSIDARPVSRYRTLDVSLGTSEAYVQLDSTSLSDGTLRALALLTAVCQPTQQALVAIEEPEVALHPYAAGLLVSGLLSSPHVSQFLLSTHSPSVLDADAVELSMLRVVSLVNGATVVGPLSNELLSEIKDRLTTGSELLIEGGLLGEPSKQARTLRPSSSS